MFGPNKYSFKSNKFFFKTQKLMHFEDIIPLIEGKNLFDLNKFYIY